MRRAAVLISVLVLSVLVLGACGGSTTKASTTAPPTTADPAATHAATTTLRTALRAARAYASATGSYTGAAADKLTPADASYRFADEVSDGPAVVAVAVDDGALVLVVRAADGTCYGVMDPAPDPAGTPPPVRYGKAAGSHPRCAARDISNWSDDVNTGWA